MEDYEIDLKKLQEMASTGGHNVYWVLGPTNTDLIKMNLEINEEVVALYPEQLLEEKNPKSIVGDEPILVCEHGITSGFLCKDLRKKGVNAYSLAGGIDGMRG